MGNTPYPRSIPIPNPNQKVMFNMSNPRPSITIRFGASSDDIAVDGNTFTRHKLSRADQGFLRRVVIGALEKSGYFTKEGRK